MSEPDSVIRNLRATLDNEPGLADRLERSLQQARRRAESELNEDLYEALEWPRDIGEYEAYLKRFLRWVPHESDADAWKNESGRLKRSAIAWRTSTSWWTRVTSRPRAPVSFGNG